MQTSRPPKVLYEIRLRRAEIVRGCESDRPVEDELWRPCTPEGLRRLQNAAEIGSQLFGPQSHWVERRQA